MSEYASAALGGAVLDGEEIYLRAAAEEAVSDSARVGAASCAAGRALLILALAASGGFATGRRLADVLLPPTPPESPATRPRPAPRRPPLPAWDAALDAPRIPADDERAQKALLLAGDWRGRDDGLSVDERLGIPVDLPGTAPAWSAERLGESTYLVTRRGRDGEDYVFEVDLDLNRAAPDRTTRLRLSPQLTAIR